MFPRNSPRKELKRKKSTAYVVTVHKSSLSSEGALHLGTLKTSHDTESFSLVMVNYAFVCLEKFSDL